MPLQLCTRIKRPTAQLYRKRLKGRSIACLLWITVTLPSMFALIGCKGGETVSAPHISATLISDQKSISPGSTFTLGIQFKLEPGWHIYWKNPGDSGLPPRFSWTTTSGISVSEPLWPYPSRISSGPLVNYGYEDILVPFQARFPQMTASGSAIITASLEWLVCKDECLPGEGSISIKLPIHQETSLPSIHSKEIERALARVPIPLDETSIAIEEQADHLVLALIPLKGRFLPSSIFFFPEDRRLISNSAEQKIDRDGDVLRVTLRRDPANRDPVERLRGVLFSPEGWSPSGSPLAVSIDTNPGESKSADSAILTGDAPEQRSLTSQPAVSLLAALFSALIGGLLLNIMPCVFPILSIKILGFVQHAGDDPRSARNHGLAFAAGVIISFWIVAFVLYALRAGGEQLGWGFQLQSPTFVVTMMITFLILGLLFLSDLALGQQIQNLAGRARIPTTLIGSFLNGALATLVATPCTAPFMSTALAATLAMPTHLSFIIFTALGIGMSAPYVLLARKPQLLTYLPKPGEWMVTFKQLMAFPLFMSVVWLTRVFMRQIGIEPPALTVISDILWGLLGIACAFWIYSKAVAARSNKLRLLGALVAASLFLLSLISALPNQREIEESRSKTRSSHGTSAPFTDSRGLLWEPFSEERIAKVLAQGRPVFVDFTAEWCITCQVNEKVVFSSAAVRELLVRKNVTLFKADWTSKDPAITSALRRYGRSGVPLNIIQASPGADPAILPNILTPSIVLDELNKLP